MCILLHLPSEKVKHGVASGIIIRVLGLLSKWLKDGETPPWGRLGDATNDLPGP